MAISNVRKKTPNFLKPMLRECATVDEFRARLRDEINYFREGRNPLKPAQYGAIQKLLDELEMSA